MAKTTTNKSEAAEAPKSDKMKAFEDALAMLNKEIKSETGTIVSKLGDRPMEVETISSGSVVLDSISGGGLPKGRLIEIYGPEASGKTSIALIAVGNVQREGGTALFVDLENALDPKYARKLGVNTSELAVTQPDYAEQALQLVYRAASSGVVDIIVVDSIASMVPKAELEGDMEQQTIGLLARLMSKALRQLITVANRTGTTIIFINQTRDAIGSFSPYGTPQTTPGGKAMKFYASMRIDVKKRGPVKVKNEIVGTEVKLKIVKNKVAPPFGEDTTVLTFNKGINVAAELHTVAPKHGIIEIAGRTWIEKETGEIIAKTKDDALAAIESDKALQTRLANALREKMTADLFEDTDETVSAEDEELTENDLLEDDVIEADDELAE